jgi:predicted PurR-regulated permease PerM
MRALPDKLRNLGSRVGRHRHAPDPVPALPAGPAIAVTPLVPEPELIATDEERGFDDLVPPGLQIAASWSWRVLVIGLLIVVLGYIVRSLSEVTVPLAVAILLAAMLAPLTNRLADLGVPRGLAAAVAVIGGLVVIAGALTLIGTQIAGQARNLGSSVVTGFDQLVTWVRDGPLRLDPRWFNYDEWVRRLQTFLVNSQDTIATYASEIGTQVGHFLAGTAIALFALFFFLYEGRSIFAFLLRFFPRATRQRVDNASRLGWVSLSHYVRAVVLIALVDAIGVLIVALILGVPLAPALATLVFIGAFVPIVGALVSGFVAVIVALVALGWVKALIMLAGIVAVMQIEGHILQPFLLGRAVRLHALAVIIGIAVGVIVAGIVGALFAIPLLAFLKTFISSLQGPSPQVSLNDAT